MRSRLTPAVTAASITLAATGLVGTPAVARTITSGPYIGCDSLHPYARQARWIQAPSGSCETGGSLGTLEGIRGARWSHWGGRTATAAGYLVDGLGYRYPATITALHLRRTSHDGRRVSYYASLHVVARARDNGGVVRGPYDVHIDVAPRPATAR